ncbi:KIAA0513 [Cordylochernes scorpioides]|uniref:KIAA0513 n=1 Tax=Cordylochernes scorpioides TaxID=51811 RepID=A0ABY6LJ10_9ARAC|nr:KIAA0513 [Cordylochernes scorpioides]
MSEIRNFQDLLDLLRPHMASIKALATSPSIEGGKNDLFGSARKKSHDFFSSIFNSSTEASSQADDAESSGVPSGESNPRPSGRFFSSMLPSKFTELSVKLEAAINNLSLDNADSDDTSSNIEESAVRTTKGDVVRKRTTDTAEVERPPDASQPPLGYKKKTACWKDRSVYGQPEIWSLSTKGKVSSEVSLDSLDTLDSDLQSLGNRSSISGGRDNFTSNHHPDPFYVFRRHSDSAAMVSESCGPSTSLDSSDNESLPERGCLGRSVSGGSWTSSLSYDSQPEDSSSEVVEFIKKFVEKIFINSPLSFEEKAKFGEVTRQELGRLWFARIINAQRVFNKQVSETTFYSLVQFFAIVLFECAEADDFSPAKTLMNMCFTFYQTCEFVTQLLPQVAYLLTLLAKLLTCVGVCEGIIYLSTAATPLSC